MLCMFRLCNNNPKGDGFRNFLVFELCQRYLGFENDRLFEFYHEYQLIERKVKVSNNRALETNFNETEVTGPTALAEQLRDFKQQHQDCMIIVRFSTSEPVVKVTIQSLRP